MLKKEAKHTPSFTGFTLIELLMVVVIIGILASLVIPRFTGQTEKARVAEATNILGAMHRGNLGFFDQNGSYAPTFFDWSGNPSNAVLTQRWQQLGLGPPYTLAAVRNPVAEQIYWLYGVSNGNGSVYARRTNFQPPANATPNSWIGLTVNGTWIGTGDYAPGQPYAPTK